MRYLSEYRSFRLVKKLLEEIKSVTTREWKLMEICGGQTHSLVKNGILGILPREITMIHGPGCPVCVTPAGMIDKAIELSFQPNTLLCSFGDMIRVPGSGKSLLQARSEGGNIKIVYSPTEALEYAKENPGTEVVFFAVGFETTAPANALAVLQAASLKLENFSILASHVLVPPAMEAIMDDEFNSVNGFLAAGHVCTVMGMQQYYPLAEKYRIPIVVTGFEPVDLLEGILMAVKQLEAGKAEVKNQYSRVVQPSGNPEARKVIDEVFEISGREWRGIGNIPESGFAIRKKYQGYNAEYKFGSQRNATTGPELCECIAGDILRGIKKPRQCSLFGKSCSPVSPKGAPMVSSEGACAAYYHWSPETAEL